MRRIAFSMAAISFMSGSASAAPTTTADAGHAGHHLINLATCGEVMDAFSRIEEVQPASEILLLIHFVTFSAGYAQAKGINQEEASREIMTRCFADLDQPFAGDME